MSNVLSEEKKQQVIALGKLGWSLRRIERETGVRRETAGAYLKAAGHHGTGPGCLGKASGKGTLKSTRPGLWCPWRITELGPKLAFFSGFDIGSFIPTTSRFIPALSGLPVIQQVASVRSSRSTRRLVGTNRAKNRWSMRFASWRDGLARGMKGWCKEFGAGQGMEYISQRSGCRKLLSRLLFGFLFGWRNDLQFQVLHQFLFALIFK